MKAQILRQTGPIENRLLELVDIPLPEPEGEIRGATVLTVGGNR